MKKRNIILTIIISTLMICSIVYNSAVISDVAGNIKQAFEGIDLTEGMGAVTVRYLDENGEELLPSVTTIAEILSSYETSYENIYGYSIKSIPMNANGRYVNGETLVDYIYKKRTGRVIVKYVDELNNILASSNVYTGYTNDDYEIIEKEFYGYYLKSFGDITGKYTESDIEVILVYAKVPASVKVNYLDETMTSIKDSITINGFVNGDYVVAAADVSGYQVKFVPANASGKFTPDQIVVNYIYELKKSNVIIKYVDEDGKDIVLSEKISGLVSKDYNVSAKDIYGYKLKVTPENATGRFEEEDATVTFVYEKKESTVTIKYVDETQSEIEDSDTLYGNVSDQYIVEPKKIYGYGVKEIPLNISGEFKEDETTVTIVYKKATSIVVVNYYDAKGNLIAVDSKSGNVGDIYKTDRKTIYGYKIKTIPDNEQGILTEEEIVVNYVYDILEGRVIIEYITLDGKLLQTATLTAPVGTDYNIVAPVLSGYDMFNITDNSIGKYKEETQIVTVTYQEVGKYVIVKYTDETGKELSEAVTYTGELGESYSTTAIEIPGYEVVSVPEDSSGVFGNKIKVITYIYKSTSYKKGDLNKDTYVDTVDAAIILTKYKSNSATKEDVFVGDMNEDGIIDSVDAAIILTMYKNK